MDLTLLTQAPLASLNAASQSVNTDTLALSAPTEWYRDFFNETYWQLFMKRTVQKIYCEENVITQLLPASPQRVLDVCSGVGDILEALANHYGLSALTAQGLELSSDYVEYAALHNQRSKVLLANALEPQATNPLQFDLVLNWFSSYAYFSPPQTLHLLKNCYDYTAPNGTFLLEAYTAEQVLANFKPQIDYTKQLGLNTYEINRLCDKTLSPYILNDQRLECLEQIWKFHKKDCALTGSHTKNSLVFQEDTSTQYQTLTYLYSVNQIKELLSLVGFKHIELYARQNISTLQHTTTKEVLTFVPWDLNTAKTIESYPRWVIRCQK